MANTVLSNTAGVYQYRGSFLTGQTSLKKIYNFVLQNKIWSESQLDIPPLWNPEDTRKSSAERFIISTESMEKKSFNPLHSFSHIGNNLISHVGIPS